MTLTSHAVAGAAAAELFPAHPVLAFAAAFLSHFVLDSIPHRDYKLESYVKDYAHPDDIFKLDMIIGPAFWRDLLKIALDCALGFFLAIALFHSSTGVIYFALLGAAGGVLPDALQFAFFKFKHQPLTALERIHVRIQRHRFPVESFQASMVAQAIVLVLVFGIMRYLQAF